MPNAMPYVNSSLIHCLVVEDLIRATNRMHTHMSARTHAIQITFSFVSITKENWLSKLRLLCVGALMKYASATHVFVSE